MEARLFKDIIAVISAEQQRRASLLENADPNLADDQWLFRDMPFVNGLCLMLLVTLRHQIERELVGLAARASDDGEEISSEQYRLAREQLGRPGAWEKVSTKLRLQSCDGYDSMAALRLLSNSYKHDPSTEPDQKLLRLLSLKTEDSYAPLPESQSLQESLAAFIGLGKEATYCDIAERFVTIAGCFLAHVESRTRLSPVKRNPISLNTFAH